jgi:hypothetical protein
MRMRKRKQYLWEVTRIGCSPETSFIIGSVYGAVRNQALKAAIKLLKVQRATMRAMAWVIGGFAASPPCVCRPIIDQL